MRSLQPKLRGGAVAADGSGIAVNLPAFGRRFRQRLREPRFWVVQALVVFVTVGHALAESSEAFDHLGSLYFLPASLYFVPVLYASLNFGREGAIPTAIWSGLLAIPNIIIWHSGTERLGEATQMGLMVVIAVLVALRVDRERDARRRAESEEDARRLSQAKYQRLFESAGQAILILDHSGVVEEANAAAGALFGRPAATLQGMTVAGLLGGEEADRLLRLAHDGGLPAGEFLVGPSEGPTVWVEPICSTYTDLSGRTVIQAVLRDVTRRRERERGLESYAAEMLRAQEEERLRIAREIHDGSLQSLVRLCRALDAAEEGTGSDPRPSGRVEIAAARELAEGIVDELRDFSRNLRPSVLDDLGLVAAIRGLVKDLEARSGVGTLLEVEGSERRAHPDIELCLFRIAQEALRNVEQHAAASRVLVTLAYEDRRLLLSVADDGRGFDRAESPGSGSSRRLGLRGMEERALMLGGEFSIAPRPGGGTLVAASVPVHFGIAGPPPADERV